MLMSDLFEVAMLVCLSISRHISLWRVLRGLAVPQGNTSILYFISTAYALGLGSKLLTWSETGDLGPVIVLYAWNLIICSTDLFLTRTGYSAHRIEAERAQ